MWCCGAKRHGESPRRHDEREDRREAAIATGVLFRLSGDSMVFMPAQLKLRFDPAQIMYWAGRYAYADDAAVETGVSPRTKKRGCFDRDDFLVLCRWKAPRAERHYVQNADVDIRAVTSLALATVDERLKISLMMALHGVNWPIASVMLHFGAQDVYPILDVRALWSLGVPKVNFYTFGLWWTYTQQCRQLAREAGVTMRNLDRALWQYSKEKQGSAAAAV